MSTSHSKTYTHAKKAPTRSIKRALNSRQRRMTVYNTTKRSTASSTPATSDIPLTPAPVTPLYPSTPTIVTNPSFNAPAVAKHPIATIKPGPVLINEANIRAKLEYENKVKQSRIFRISEYLRDHQSQMRAAILAIPSLAIMYATHDASMYASSLVDSYTQNAQTTAHALMSLGALQAGVAYWLFATCNKILSLAGQPSESAIQDILRHTLRNEKLQAQLGTHFKLGHFVSVSTRPSELRLSNNKTQHYEEWLQFQSGKFTQPIPEIPFPKFIQSVLSIFPAFQTTAWNTAVAEKIAFDMKQHPKDYLSDSESSESSESEAETPESPVKDSTAQTEVEQTQLSKRQEYDVTNYSGYERYWKPRRLQFSAHLVGSKDEGLLLTEIEKYQFGPGYKGSGGLMKYKVFQFVSLKTGKVTNLDNGPERPSLLTHAHIQKLFDTIPVEYPTVEPHTFDYILVEDKYKTEIAEQLQLEKQKTDVKILH